MKICFEIEYSLYDEIFSFSHNFYGVLLDPSQKTMNIFYLLMKEKIDDN